MSYFLPASFVVHLHARHCFKEQTWTVKLALYKMFRLHKTLDVITLFHRPAQASSARILNLLRQAAEMADKASKDERDPKERFAPVNFELNVTEEPPTSDQLRNIMDYVGLGKIGALVRGAKSEADVLKKVKEDPDSFQRPVTVDWNNGRAVVGEEAQDIVDMLNLRK
ncbi:MAG: hypothetical protein M1826_003425 [Phylliscum demangeonii]|nr:MAG: hypothetical protein M1826_003425 [Phylliscum demangeonii]